MRAFELIVSVVIALFVALKLCHAFQNHGDFDAYLFGVLNVMLGIAIFWRSYSGRNGKREP
jgi:hypothetical protein